jgi:YYY domain-containing protein
VLALALTGLLLIGGTELLFVKDLFSNRMNTVFKLYYQAWALLSVVAAYGLYYLVSIVRSKFASGRTRAGARVALVVALIAVLPGLVYAPAALASRIGVAGTSRSLDGIAWLARSTPADAAAIAWLEANVSGNPVVVEASGGSYSQFARVSSSTGLPTILGWEFHEVQWRGTADPQRQRQADLATIYGSNDPGTVLAALARYDARYVYVGALEREKYGAGRPITDFSRFLETVYDRNGVAIYRVRP